MLAGLQAMLVVVTELPIPGLCRLPLPWFVTPLVIAKCPMNAMGHTGFT